MSDRKALTGGTMYHDQGTAGRPGASMPELPPCPCCFGSCVLSQSDGSHWSVTCAEDDCGMTTGPQFTEADAIRVWSRRPDAAVQAAEVERIVSEALKREGVVRVPVTGKVR